MIEEIAQVTAVDSQTMLITADRKSACKGCQISDSCGTGVISKFFNSRAIKPQFKVPRDERYNVGDLVVIGIEENALISGALTVYLIPLVGLFAGLVIGALVQTGLSLSSELIIIAGAALGLFSGFIASRRVSRRFAQNGRYQPSILRKA